MARASIRRWCCHRSASLVLLLPWAACVTGEHGSRAGLGGTVASASPEATAAGLRVLAAGGNAVDAAVAVAFSLAVTEPAGSGVAGQAFVLVQRPGEPALVLHGSTIAPRATRSDAGAADLRGRRACTVPSMVKVLDLAHRRFGSGRLAWAELLRPAIDSASRGFELGPFRRHSIARYAGPLGRDPAVAQVFLRPDGTAPEIGDVIRQQALANTLQRLAVAGAEDFYRGEIAAAIAADMAANGGWITQADLESLPEPRITTALHGTYRGFDVWTLPPPAGGWAVLTALDLLERAPEDALARLGSDRTLWMAEALRVAHLKRLDEPLQDPDDETALRERLDKGAAADVAAGFRLESDGGETTHFCVVDADGMVVATTMSLNAYFGARTMSPTLGVLYNDYMREFVRGDPEHPFALRAGAMPFSSMSATILSKDGVPRFAVGSPGSRRIISAVVQSISNFADAGMDARAAVAAPRLHVRPETGELMFEQPPRDRTLLLDLELRGFRPTMPLSSLFADAGNPYFGGVHAVGRTTTGAWLGGADPRRDGVAASVSKRP